MIWRVYRAIGRHYRAVLAVGAVLALACLAAQRWAPDVADGILPAVIVVALGSILASAVGWGMPRIAGFDVRPEKRALRAAQHPAAVLLLIGQLFMMVLIAHTGTFLLWLLVAVLAITFVATWIGTGIELRPDGLRERVPLGYQFVPWEALPATRVTDDRPGLLTVSYGRPEMVRRRGLTFGRKWLRHEAVHPIFASDAIRFYATLPEERPAIGTPEGYRRLREATGFDR